MKLNYAMIGLLGAMAIFTPSRGGSAEASAPVLFESPGGAFRVEGGDDGAWVVSGKAGGVRDKLPGDSAADIYFSSPDEQWLFGLKHVAHGFRSGALFQHSGRWKAAAAGPGGSFNEAVWQWTVKQGALKANYAAEEAGADIGFTSYIGWGADSARLLMQLSGGSRHKDLHYAYVYYNMRTNAFELTDYLRTLNKLKAPPAACAELVDAPPAEAELRVRFDKADHLLNQTYVKQLAGMEKGAAEGFRSEQRDWIKRRDEGLKLYVALFPAAEQAARRWQYLGEVTAYRASELLTPSNV